MIAINHEGLYRISAFKNAVEKLKFSVNEGT